GGREARGLPESQGQQDRADHVGREGGVVAEPRHRLVRPLAIEAQQRGDGIRPARQAPKEEVEQDEPGPVGRADEMLSGGHGHHSSPPVASGGVPPGASGGVPPCVPAGVPPRAPAAVPSLASGGAPRSGSAPADASPAARAGSLRLRSANRAPNNASTAVISTVR